MKKLYRRGADLWRSIVAGQPGSGLSIAAYCRQQGISQPSFFAWRRRLCLRQRRPGSAAASFVEVTGAPAAQGEASVIEVRLRGGRGLLARRGFDRDLLVELIGVLEELPSRLEALA
jgi:hypothetical protein